MSLEIRRLWHGPDITILPLVPSLSPHFLLPSLTLYFPSLFSPRLLFPSHFPYLHRIRTSTTPWFRETHDGKKYFVKRYNINLPSGYSFTLNVGIQYTNPEIYRTFYDEETGNLRLTLKELFAFVYLTLEGTLGVDDEWVLARLVEFKRMIIHSLIDKCLYPLPPSPPSLPFQITSPCA